MIRLLGVQVAHQQALAHRTRLALAVDRQVPLERPAERRHLFLGLRDGGGRGFEGNGLRPHAVRIDMLEALGVPARRRVFRLGHRLWRGGRLREAASKARAESGGIRRRRLRGGRTPRVTQLAVQGGEWGARRIATTRLARLGNLIARKRRPWPRAMRRCAGGVRFDFRRLRLRGKTLGCRFAETVLACVLPLRSNRGRVRRKVFGRGTARPQRTGRPGREGGPRTRCRGMRRQIGDVQRVASAVTRLRNRSGRGGHGYRRHSQARPT